MRWFTRDFHLIGIMKIVYNGEASKCPGDTDAAKAYVLRFEFGIGCFFLRKNLSAEFQPNALLRASRNERMERIRQADMWRPIWGIFHMIWKNKIEKRSICQF